ncbi:MAG: glutamyl-tRNA reductase [Planctomycetota bacterium]
MKVGVLGVNHQTAPVAVREKLAFDRDAARALLAELRRRFGAAVEAVLVSTCNRTELYLVRPSDSALDADAARVFLANQARVEPDVVSGVTIYREQQAAVRHLFRVCGGLDSMVVGEPHILGQVRRAYESSSEAGHAGPMTHLLFQRALSGAKTARRTTNLDAGRPSIASIASDLSARIFDRLDDHVVVGLGAGEAAKALLAGLARQRPKRLWVVNRTLDRAAALADQLSLDPNTGGARHLDDLETLLVEADIVACGTASPDPVITAKALRTAMRKRRGRPLLLLDVALPRDVEPEAARVANVYLYGLDELQEIAQAQAQGRHDEVRAAHHLLLASADACWRDLGSRQMGRLIRTLRSQLHELGKQEATRTAQRLAAERATNLDGVAIDPAAAEPILEDHARRLVNKILHPVMERLHREADDAPMAFYSAALRRLFDLPDEDGPDQDARPRDESTAAEHPADDAPVGDADPAGHPAAADPR